MKLTNELKQLLNGYEMACVNDFIDEEEVEVYLDNTDLGLIEIGVLCEKYSGWSIDSFRRSIINELNKHKNK